MSPPLRALFALLALAAGGFASSAAAAADKLNNTPAEKFIIAPGGVDMRTGRYVYNETDLSIGGEGNGGLALTRTLTANAPNGHFNPFASLSHNWDIMVTETQSEKLNERNEYDRFAHVHFGGRSQTFPAPKVGGAALAQISPGIAQSLSFEGDRAVGGIVYTYTAQDGTVAVFRPFRNDCGASCAYVSRITEADGTRFSFDYESADGRADGRIRLTRVTSSRGYALILEGSGYFVNKACVVNLARTAAGSVCPAGVQAATYTYSTTDKTRLATVTGPDQAVSRFTQAALANGGTATGFVKPGYETPWLTNSSHAGNDELGVVQDIVDRQDFADGQSYNYSIDGAPHVTYKPSGVAGGSYWNALGEQTDVKFEWPREPGQNTPGSLCRRLPCEPVQADSEYSWVYQQTPGPVTIADPLGNKTKFDYCEEAPMRLLPGNILDRCIVFGAPLVVTDPEGIKTEFKYDVNLNAVWAKRYPKPDVLNPDGSVPAPTVTSAVYDTMRSSKSANKPLSLTDSRGNATTWTYAPEHGGVLTETGPGVNGVTPQKRYFYVQRYARLAASELAGPPVWLLDRISTCRAGNPSGDGCALGSADEIVTSFDYGPDRAGTNLELLGQAVTADGRTPRTCFAYDALGRKISETSPNGTAGLSSCPISAPTTGLPYTTSTRYDSGNRVTGTIAADPDGAGPLPSPAVRNSYDPAGRLIRVEEGALSAWQGENVAPALWPGFEVHRIVDTSYDALDRKTREAVIGGPWAERVTEYGYDLAGRLKCTAVRMNPDAWGAPLPDKCVPGPAHATYGPDRISKIVYDKSGRVIETWDGVGTPLQRREAAYTYDGNGQKLTLADARGFVAEMKYDGFGRQSRWVFPSKVSAGAADQNDYERYGYDAAGNRTSLRKRDGSVLTFQYDALNRMTVKIVPERAGLSPVHTRDVHYGYDLRGLQTKARFDSLSGEGVTNVYDGFGRLVSSGSDMGGTARTIASLYDSEGNRTRITHPDGNYFTYETDGLGRPTWIRENGGQPLNAYTYDRAGRRATSGWGATTYGYDHAGRLQSLSHDLVGTSRDIDLGFTYNPAGQIITRSSNNDAYAWTGAVAAVRPHSANGQNQYTSAGSATFAYDPNGNLASTVNAPWSTAYTYDVENRLVSASGTHDAELVYDPLGRLFQVSSGSSVRRLVYDGDALIAEYDAAGNMTHRYIHGADPGSDDPIAWYHNAVYGWRQGLAADHQGSIIQIADMYGNPIFTNSYDEYGIPGANNQGRFGYTGQAWVPELGLWYYKARFYSPYTGRFLQVDPIGYEDQVNLYAYVGNDPVNKVDPTGKCSSIAGKGAKTDCLQKRAAAIGDAKGYLGTQSVKSGQKEAAYIATYNEESRQVTVRTGDAAGMRSNSEVDFLDNKGGRLVAQRDGRIIERSGSIRRRTKDIVLVTGHGHPKENTGGGAASRSLDRANDNIRQNQNDRILSQVAPAVIKGTSGDIKVYWNEKELK